MNEIKFRVWDRYNKRYLKIKKEFSEWFVSLSNFEIYELDYDMCTHQDKEGNSYLVLEQYIGLKDKNDVEIYSGDSLKVKDNLYKNEFIGDVQFRNGSFMINQDEVVSHYRWIDYDIEIIGNIHQK